MNEINFFRNLKSFIKFNMRQISRLLKYDKTQYGKHFGKLYHMTNAPQKKKCVVPILFAEIACPKQER